MTLSSSALVAIALVSSTLAFTSLTQSPRDSFGLMYEFFVLGSQTNTFPSLATASAHGTVTNFDSDALRYIKGRHNRYTNFGVRFSGQLCPPEIGRYSFRIANDDGAKLYIQDMTTPHIDNSGIHIIANSERDSISPITFSSTACVAVKLEYQQAGEVTGLVVEWLKPNVDKFTPIPSDALKKSTKFNLGDSASLEAELILTFNSDANKTTVSHNSHLQSYATDESGYSRNAMIYMFSDGLSWGWNGPNNAISGNRAYQVLTPNDELRVSVDSGGYPAAGFTVAMFFMAVDDISVPLLSWGSYFQGDHGATASSPLILGVTGGRPFITNYGSGPWTTIATDAIVSAGQWYHIAFVNDPIAKTTKIYLNAHLVTTTDVADRSFAYTPADNPVTLIIGRNPERCAHEWPNYVCVPYNAINVDDVRVFSTVLNHQEIDALWTFPLAVKMVADIQHAVVKESTGNFRRKLPSYFQNVLRRMDFGEYSATHNGSGSTSVSNGLLSGSFDPAARGLNTVVIEACRGYYDCMKHDLPVFVMCPDCGPDESCDGDCAYEPDFWEFFSDNSAGWDVGPQWQIGRAVGSSTCHASEGQDPSTDTTGTTDNGIAGVVIGGCVEKSVPHDDYCLTSPPIAIYLIPGRVTFEFKRHLHTEARRWMRHSIQVFDGADWSTIWENGDVRINDPAWMTQFLDLTNYKNTAFKLRFCFSMGDGWNVASWNIDDLHIYPAHDV